MSFKICSLQRQKFVSLKGLCLLITLCIPVIFLIQYGGADFRKNEFSIEYKGVNNKELNLVLRSVLARNLDCRKCQGADEFTSCYCENHFLSCDEITSIDLIKRKKLGGGLGKLVYTSIWDENVIALVTTRASRINSDWIVNRVEDGLRNIAKLRTSPFVIPSYGFCVHNRTSYLLTESCTKYGDLYNFMTTERYKEMSEIGRFKISVQVIASFHFLHSSLDLPRVHCDLHTAEESMKQFLVADDTRLFMGDLDEIPPVDVRNNLFAKCKEESRGIMKQPSFIAPEQRYTVQEFKKKISQKPITEKSDVWKFPDLTDLILTGNTDFKIGESSNSEFMNRLKNIHTACKETEPSKRPKSEEVLIEYLKLLNKIL